MKTSNINLRRELRPKAAAQRLNVSIGYIYQLLKLGLLDSRAIVLRGRTRGVRLIAVNEKFLAIENPSESQVAGVKAV